MEIGAIGYNYSHDADFIMDRPNGFGCYLILLVKEKSIFEINGVKHDVKEGSFVMLTPTTSVLYKASGDKYCDDWLFFSVTDEDIARFQELDIPFNMPVYLSDITEISQIMHILSYEHFVEDVYHQEIEQHYIDLFLLKLSRAIKTTSQNISEQLSEKNYMFTQLRHRIYTMPETVLGIDEVAAEMHLSRSGLQHSYKKIFGTSIIKDLINSRINRAKRLLSTTNLTIKEISEQCGYNSEFNLMRQFKDKVGMTPTEYRKIL